MYEINDEQSEHAQVVAARAQQFGLLYNVLTVLDCEDSVHLDGAFPDIIVMNERNTVIFIEEVETETSVTEQTRNDKWLRYAEYGYPLNLIVPKSQVLKARQILDGIDIHHLYFYQLTPIGVKFRQVGK
jgi:hypothetical protein